MVPADYVPDTSLEKICDFLGPCAVNKALEEGNYGLAAFELLMMVPIPIGRAGKLGKLLKGADNAGDAARIISHSVDELSAAAGAIDRNHLTFAGRSLQKHGSRPGSSFAFRPGPAAEVNAQARVCG